MCETWSRLVLWLSKKSSEGTLGTCLPTSRWLVVNPGTRLNSEA